MSLEDKLKKLPRAQRELLARKLLELDEPATRDVAIVGVGCRLPRDVAKPDDLWEVLKNRSVVVSNFPANRGPFHPDEVPSIRKGGSLSGADLFDAEFFGFSPLEALCADPNQRLLLEVAWEALEDAATPVERLEGTSTGVFIGAGGVATEEYRSRAVAAHPEFAQSAVSSLHNILACRLSYFFDLRGPSVVVDTACSSSLVALHQAVVAIKSGECDRALVGTVNLALNPEPTRLLDGLGLLAPDAVCRPFDQAATGFVRSEACVVLLLRPVEQALADGDPIWGIIKGSAVNSDGRSNGLMAPNGEAQKALIRKALESAALLPRQISYVEAHGTGSVLGDAIELDALNSIYGVSDGPVCYLRSGKANLGHTESASGLVSLLSVLSAFRTEQVPPQANFDALHKEMSLAKSRLRIDGTAGDWPGRTSGARLAAISSLGLGGTNAHLIVAEPPLPASRPQPTCQETSGLLLLSAKSETALKQMAADFRDLLNRTPQNWREICLAAARGRSRFRHRLAVIGETASELSDELENYLQGRTGNHFASVLDGRRRTAPGELEKQYEDGDLRSRQSRLAQAFLKGVEVLWEGPAPREIRLPGYPFQRSSYWLEAGESVGGDREFTPARGEYHPPRSPVEEALVAIWSEVLSLEKIGIRDDFFGLGGHSLHATQVVSRIAKVLGVDLPVSSLFEHPTIEGLERLLQGGTEAQPPLLPVAREGEMPLSFAQERLWFLSELVPDNPFYNIPIFYRLRGSLDVPALSKAMTRLQERHETLRTRVLSENGKPFQVIDPVEPFQLEVEESSSESFQAMARKEALRPFDLANEHPLRVRLFRLSEQEHVLLINQHHIASDGWSLGVLQRELSCLYLEDELEPLPIQYADFAVWQRHWLSGQVLESQLSYWKTRLAGSPSALELPYDRPRPRVQSFRAGVHEARLPPQLIASLKKLSEQAGCTLFMSLLAAFSVLMQRYSGQDDLVIGSPIANRNKKELEGLIGFFVNTLALRLDLSGDPEFLSLLQQVRATCLEAYAHQDLPFERLVNELAVERSLDRQPLVQVVLALQNSPLPDLVLGELQPSRLELTGATVRMDLELHCWEVDGALDLCIMYSADLFEPATIEKMFERFRLLLERICEAPEASLGDISLLLPEDARLLQEWNATDKPVAEEQTVVYLFEEHVRSRPNAVAVIDDHGEMTYSGLNERANRLAHYLIEECPTTVGIKMERSIDLMVAVLGVLKSGAAYVPLDPSYPAERLAFMEEDSGAELVLTGELPELSAYPSTNPRRRAGPDDLAYVIYTSGTTGTPKGAELRHRGLTSLSDYQVGTFGLSEDSLVVSMSSPSFDAFVFEFVMALTSGGTLGLPAQAVTSPLLRRATHAVVVPSVLATLSPDEFCALRVLVLAGEVCNPQLARLWQQSTGASLFNAYGPTEATICSTVFSEFRGDDFPIGRPISNTRVYVLDENLRALPVGVPGELCVAGIGLANGYRNRPELTAEKFVLVEVPGRTERVYRTGDLARFRADGNIDFLGRLDHQVKLRGFRIELREIESALLEQQGVREALVLLKGEGAGQFLAAYVVPQHAISEELSSEGFGTQLQRGLKERLPDYMVPSSIMVLESFPLTPNGKVDRRALPEPQWQQRTYAPPVSPAQEMLVEIWSEVLNVDPIGIRDDFFELGGHSLHATQVISRISRVMGVELPVKSLFENPTIEGLERLLQEGREAAPPIVAVPRQPEMPLSFAQERLWFMDRFDPESTQFSIPIVLRLRGPLQVQALEVAIRRLLERHESLRTRFREKNGKAVAFLAEPSNLTHHQVSDEAEALEWVQQLLKTPFQLDGGALFRPALLRIAPQDHVLVLVVHHILSDGWSQSVLTRDLSALYQGIEPPQLPLQYLDFVAWQRNRFQQGHFEQGLRFWKQQLEGAPTVLDLDFDHPRPAVQTLRAGATYRSLPKSLTRLLQQSAREHGTTVFPWLLSAFWVTLSTYSGRRDFLTSTVVAGRTQHVLEDVLGLFVNTLVLRAELGGVPTFEELVKLAHEQYSRAFEYQDIPFEQVVKVTNPERRTDCHPLAQVAFNYQNTGTPELEFSDLDAEPFGGHLERTELDLDVHVIPDEEGLKCAVVYALDLFEESTVQELLADFQAILERVLKNPSLELSRLLGNTRTSLVAAPTEVRQNFDVTLSILARAAVRPQATALVGPGTESLSYEELSRGVHTVANRLRSLGVGPEDRVGILLERSLDLPVALLGIWKAGAVAVPLDPNHASARLQHILDDAEPVVVLTRPDQVGNIRGAQTFPTDWLEMASESPPISPDQLSYLIYTSGTTGTPKGVAVSRGAFNTHCEEIVQKLALDSTDRVLQFAAQTFDVFLEQLLPPLTVGATVVLRGDELWTIPEFTSRIEAQGVTVADLPPDYLREFLRHGVPPSCLRLVSVGGDVFPVEAVTAWNEMNRPFTLYNAYGPTEAVITATLHAVDAPSQTVPLGRPLSGRWVEVRDEAGLPAPLGSSGEICLGGLLARGYHDDPRMTALRFVPSERRFGGRSYRTGDRGFIKPGGALEFVGRIDREFKVRGIRISPQEIEASLLSCSGVRKAKVSICEGRLVACLEADPGQDLYDYLKPRLPQAMIPELFLLVDDLDALTGEDMSELVKTRSKKHSANGAGVSAEPLTANERLLLRLWEEAIGIEGLSRRDNFFQVGGDSILALGVVAKAREAGLVLNVSDFFAAQTVEELASLVRSTASLRVLEEAGGQAPLTPIQRWFFQQNYPNPHFHNLSLLLQTEPGIDHARLGRGVLELAEHHASLRFRYKQETGDWQQAYGASPGDDVFEFHDLSTLSPEMRCEQLARHIDRLQTSLDLQKGPVYRAAWFDYGDRNGRFFFTAHHLVVDAVSLRVIAEDLASFYQNGHFGIRSHSFAEWGRSLEAYAAELGEEAAAPWLSLADAPRFPTEVQSNQPPGTVGQSLRMNGTLSEAETARLREAVKSGIEADDLLLDALGRTLTVWSRQEEILIDLDKHGRAELFPDLDISRTVGWFTSVHPIRLNFREADSLHSVHQARKAVRNQGVDFGLLGLMVPDAALRQKIRSLPPVGVSFNNLGSFDASHKRGLFLGAAPEPLDIAFDKAQRRMHPLEVICVTTAGRLHTTWYYDETCYTTETIEQLVRSFLGRLGREPVPGGQRARAHGGP